MPTPYVAAGKYGRITATQQDYALPPGNTNEYWLYPTFTPSANLIFNEWSLKLDVDPYERTNTLSQVKQFMPSGYEGTLSLSGFITPTNLFNFWIGMLMQVTLEWNNGVNTYNFTIPVTLMSINRDLNVNSSYNVSMECKVNYNFEAGDATYVLYYNTLPGESQNRGWQPLTPTVTSLVAELPWGV